MVMPRSRSISMESSTCSFISRTSSPPVIWISRSASVDFPWSMWAMIAKLRIWSSGVVIEFLAVRRACSIATAGVKGLWADGRAPPAFAEQLSGAAEVDQLQAVAGCHVDFENEAEVRGVVFPLVQGGLDGREFVR